MAKRFAKGSVLPAHIIRYLTQRVIETFKKEYMDKYSIPYEYTNDAVLFGYGKYDSLTVDSIKTFLCDKGPIKEVINRYVKEKDPQKKKIHEVIEGNYLWKKNHEAKKNPNASIPFKDHYRDVFLTYIGAKVSEIEDEYQNSHTNFIGYYLSFADFKIKTILLRASNSVDIKGRHEVIIEGVHAKKDATKDDTYEGKIWEEDGWLYGYAS